MAEFKLGRIRFVWKNTWTAGTTYYRDDVVTNGGKMYICVQGHVAQNDFYADADITPPKWNLVADGQNWKGDWATGTYYVYNDIVKYGARLYIATSVHTSTADVAQGLEADIANWAVFGEGLNWLGDWTTSTRYKINDFIKYGGITYICNTLHNSAAIDALGLEADQEKWDVFNAGIEFKGDFRANIRFKVNDVVKYGGNLYICTAYHTSTGNFADNEDKFTQFVQGVQFERNWGPFERYQQGDIVAYGGNQYIAKRQNTAANPVTETDDWNLFAKGFNFRGDWGDDSTNIDYRIGDVVRVNGFTYVSTADSQNKEPGLAVDWASYWERLNEGFHWRGEWIDDVEYKQGDVIRFGTNSYVCIKSHISEGDDGSTIGDDPQGGGNANSRPDQDATGTYWNILVVGTETSVLTTKGDLVYYSDAGPTRLPVGKEGQVLRVSNNVIPEWHFLGSSEDVYHVAQSGTDGPAPVHGLTIDKPWKSIRYACLQVEKGTKFPEATELLETNRIFIQREAVEWTDYQIINTTPPFVGGFTYESVKCERDIGYIVDAVIWDLRHGGNVKSREAALSYVNDTVGSPYLEQKEETVASINYAITVMQKILAQEAPDTNYQVTNGDNSTAIVDQWFNAELQAEPGVTARISELVGIITDAITAGNTDNIPARDIRQVLIKVATGKYEEVLPISVPAETCIMGDELRATTVRPKAPTTAKSDFLYSYSALDRIQSIVSDVVQGIAVTPSVGNNIVQSQEWPAGEAAQGQALSHLFRSTKRNIDFKLQTKHERNLIPTYALADVDAGYARDLIMANKDFIAQEITGWLTSNYPNLKYSRTKCRQDVRFIIDAIAYDLTYGGNWQSVTAGEAYYAGTNGPLQIDSSEKAATVAAYGYLKYLLRTVGRDLFVNPTYQSDVTQVRGVAGDLAAANTIGSLMDDIIDIIRFGTGTVVLDAPDVSGASADKQTIVADLATEKTMIGQHTIDFISKNFGSFRYNSATCRRDLTNIITDIAYDVALGTNYNAVFQGLAYQRPINAYNLQNQRTETVGAIKFAKIEVADEIVDATGKTRSDAAFDEIIDIINNGTGAANAITYPSPVGVDQNKVDAKDNLVANRTFIQAEITAWIADQIATATPGSIWENFTYNSAKCARDVGHIVDAMAYDVLYGGTMATTRIAESYFGIYGGVYPAGQGAQTAAAYAHLASVLSDIVVETTITPAPGNVETQVTPGTPASATEASTIDANMQIIEDVIAAGNMDSLPAAVYPSITWAAAQLQTDKASVDTARPQIILDTIQFISDTYNDFNYIHAKCSRDVGLIIDALSYDLQLDTNFASIVAAYSYLRRPSQNVLKDQKTASLAAFAYAKTLVADVINNASVSAGEKTTALAKLDETWDWIDTVLFGGAPEGGNRPQTNQNSFAAVRQLELNKDFMVAEVHAYVNNYFSDTVTATESASDTLTVTSTDWMRTGMPIRFTGTAVGGVSLNMTYYVKEIVSATTFKIAETVGGMNFGLSDATGTMAVESAYDYNMALCERDVLEFINAAKADFIFAQEFKRDYTDGITLYYSGNYESYRAARYYVNSVLGNHEEDFYYLRNNTGLRLQTMEGLNGDLGPTLSGGYSHPTAGAYASLDPGWGPDDQRVWITARSPYVQNCTTFGYAAVGQKIDGTLHNGGNDSIVSNDFTQVISDGIGAWLLNNGRAEMVSVFTYYAHIGYLCESGGRARATNGNNSYGDFGSVANGVDAFEVPVTAIVDNTGLYDADPNVAVTDGDGLLSLEFSHAGNDYTDAVIEIFGAGQGAETQVDEFRDGGVNRIRILDLNDSSGQLGGDGYTVAENTAQAGSLTSINLAATDGSVAGAYNTMKVIVTGGAGVGQYGVIDTYNSGSKLATVLTETGTAGWDHFVPGTPIIAPNSSSTYRVEPAVSFDAPTKSAVGSTLGTGSGYRAEASVFANTSAIYTGVTGNSSSGGTGATFTVTKVGSKYDLLLEAGGLDYIRLDTITISGADVGGTTPANDIVVTVSTVENNAVLAFDFTGDAQTGVFVAKDSSGQDYVYSADGDSWTSSVLPNAPTGAATWALASGLIDDGSSVFKQSTIVAMSSVAGSTGTTAWYSEDGVSWAELTVPAITGIPHIAYNTYSNEYLAFGDGSTDIIRSGDGQSWFSVLGALPSTGWDLLAYGMGKYVILKTGTNEAAYTENNGVDWTTVTLPVSGNWQDIAWGNGRFMAISDSNVVVYSLDGIVWYDATPTGLANVAHQAIGYGQGVFVVTNSANNTVYHSEHGVVWDTVTATGISNGSEVIFGNPAFEGKFIVVSTTGATSSIVKVGATARGRVGVAQGKVFEVRMIEPGSGYDENSPPTITISDPNNIYDVSVQVRVNNGVIAQPSWISRGTGYELASADLISSESNGGADFFQSGTFVAVRRLSSRPVAGSNVVFGGLPNKTFKLVNVVSFRGDYDGSYTAFLNISPELETSDSPNDGDSVEMRIRYSQVRLTGHDFLDIGTGNFTKTNYPGVPLVAPDQAKETVDANGGRVFFTATDQDGNFRVGPVFSVEQATGIATLNADAFNIAGLQELSLGEVTLGGNSASISEFSTDPFFTANSDSVVPTQRAIKAYIEAQIGGGGASLNVNTVTAGDVFIGTNIITTVSGSMINIRANMNFQGGVTGLPVAYNYFLR